MIAGLVAKFRSLTYDAPPLSTVKRFKESRTTTILALRLKGHTPNPNSVSIVETSKLIRVVS